MAIAIVLGLSASMPSGNTAAIQLELGGIQLWNCDYWDTLMVGDFYGPNYNFKKFKPISLVGVRNGTYSGCVVLSNTAGSISGLKAKASDLVQAGEGGAKIAAAQILVRYPELATPDKSWAPPYRFDGLRDEPPEEVRMVDMRENREWKPKNVGPVATQPVWVTVRVPADAAPGDYEGTLTIEAEMLKPQEIPIRLQVHDFKLPDAKDFTVQNLGWMSPECVARHYEVPMWSDRHFELMGKSMELLLGLGSRHVEVNLVLRYLSRDNAETMIKWVKQADGTFKYDLTAFDKYMDLTAQKIGKPFPIRLNMWHVKEEHFTFPKVVVVDPATGKTEDLEQPPFGTPESYAFWKPVLDEVRAHLEKRGWQDVAGANWHQYCGGPDTNTVTMFKKIWPNGKWVDMDHGRRTGFAGVEKQDWTAVLAQSTVWNEGAIKLRGYKEGLKPGVSYNGHARGRHREWSELWDLRAVCEEQIMKGNHGIDPLGGDLWPLRDAQGNFVGGRWAACALGPGNCTRAFLVPGPNGAIATERYEAFREGVQICETILYIQRGIDAGKLDAALAERANKVLDERSQRMLDSWPKVDKAGHQRFDPAVFSKDVQERERELFATAAAVAKVVK